MLPRTNGISFPDSVRIYELGRYQVGIRHRVGIRNRQGVLENGLDGAPDVDDLVSATEKFLCLIWKVMAHAIRGCTIRLIDVDALYRTPKILATISIVLGSTTDRVVEDEDFVRAGSFPLFFFCRQPH